MKRSVLWITLLAVLSFAQAAMAADDAPQLLPGKAFALQFPDMPPTLRDQLSGSDAKAMMTVFLPANYDATHKFPLLVFLTGDDGGTGGTVVTARHVSEDKDFVCVNLPFFTTQTHPKGGSMPQIADEDGKTIWPLYKTMLAKLTQAVPNIDPAHRIIGGFSNGAHTIQVLIDSTDGEMPNWFSAFFFVEGGGRTQRFDLIKGKPMLLCYGDKNGDKGRARVNEICAAAMAAGVLATTHEMKDTAHAFPPSEFPAVERWLREVALK